MTRGKIILIQGDMQVYITCEFNGDMHPNMNGEEVLECFKNGVFQNYRGYERFVGNFNRKYWGYDEELIRELIGCDKRTIDVTKNWTDYLYIINESSDEWSIKTKENGDKLLPHSLAIIHYQMVSNIMIRKTEENLYDFISNNGVICQKEV